MFTRFLSLEWKQFYRSSYFQKGLFIKIILIFAAVYFSASFLTLGAIAFFALEETFPHQDPLELVNNYLIFWFLGDMTFRFFMQQLPVMNIKPYMIVPIKRKTIIHYLLAKTSLSFFNFLPLFFFLPFSVVLLIKGYNPLQVVSWFFSMLFFSLAINYLNFLLNKNHRIFYGIISLLIGLIAVEYYNIYPVSETCGIFFNTLYQKPHALFIPLLLLILLYRKNVQFIRKGFYLDDGITHKTKTVTTTEMGWLNRFGSLAPFLKNDLRLILRNKRPKNVLWMSFLFLFYGLFFYTMESYQDKPAFLAFASLFITGGFLMSFGQLVPSWDSEYYKLLMSQNIPYRKYLESKWLLMIVATGISFVLSIPYLYFGWNIFLMIIAGALFNVGINSFITLYGGVLNRVPVELNVKANVFGNTQGFNPTQLLIALPKILGPVLIFYIPYKLIHLEAGIIALALSGITGLVFKNFFLSKIERIYQKKKYKTIAAFAEKN